MILRAFAGVVLCLAMGQAAYGGYDKNRAAIAKRWYSEAYVKGYLQKFYPSSVRAAFNESIAYSFAADGPPSNMGGYKYYPEPLSTRQIDGIRLKTTDGKKNVDAEIDKMCVLKISSALVALKLQVQNTARKKNIRRDDLRKGVVAALRSGELTSAPLDLNSNGGRPISVIPPDGAGRLLCNVYVTKKPKEVSYQVSVALTAEGFYGRGR